MVTARKKENVVAIRNGVVCLVSARGVPWEVNRRPSAPQEVSVWTSAGPLRIADACEPAEVKEESVRIGRRCLVVVFSFYHRNNNNPF